LDPGNQGNARTPVTASTPEHLLIGRLDGSLCLALNHGRYETVWSPSGSFCSRRAPHSANPKYSGPAMIRVRPGTGPKRTPPTCTPTGRARDPTIRAVAASRGRVARARCHGLGLSFRAPYRLMDPTAAKPSRWVAGEAPQAEPEQTGSGSSAGTCHSQTPADGFSPTTRRRLPHNTDPPCHQR